MSLKGFEQILRQRVFIPYGTLAIPIYYKNSFMLKMLYS